MHINLHDRQSIQQITRERNVQIGNDHDHMYDNDHIYVDIRDSISIE